MKPIVIRKHAYGRYVHWRVLFRGQLVGMYPSGTRALEFVDKELRAQAKIKPMSAPRAPRQLRAGRSAGEGVGQGFLAKIIESAAAQAKTAKEGGGGSVQAG